MGKPLELTEAAVGHILNAVQGMRYGTVQIVVHDGRIVQIDRTERTRFEAAPSSAKDGTPAAKSGK